MMLEREAHLERDGRVRREVRALARAGHAVLVLHAGPRESPAVLAAEGGAWRSAMGHGVLARLAGRLPGPVRRIVRWGGFVGQALRARPDAVHAHDVAMLAPAWLAARMAGAVLVYDTHEYARGVPYHSRLARLWVRAVQAQLVPRCGGVIAVSPQTAAELQRDYGLATAPTVLRNIPELDWTHSPARANGVASLRALLGIGDAPIVLHQGSAGPERGCEQLVMAVGRLAGVHLLFLGDTTPQFAAVLRGLAAGGGASERVHFQTSVALEVLLAHTAQADVGICLFDPRWRNHRLTLQNKLFEYITAGVPVVATRDTAFGALVEQFGVGATVAFGDLDGLAATISAVLDARDDAALRDRLRAAARELTWASEQQRLVALYDGIGRGIVHAG